MIADQLRDAHSKLYAANSMMGIAKTNEERLSKSLEAFHNQDLMFQLVSDFLMSIGSDYEQRIISFMSKLVTAGVQDIFDAPWVVEFTVTQRSGQKALDIFLRQGDIVVLVPDGVGGGVTQVIAVLIQICMVYLLKGTVRQFIAFDESLSHLALCYQEAAASVLKAVASRLGIEILIVSHSEELAQCADTLLRFSKNGLYTTISSVGEKL